jgi:hypothetical protein
MCCAVGPMLHPMIERLDDLMLEVVTTWIGGIRKVVIAAAYYIHSRPCLQWLRRKSRAAFAPSTSKRSWLPR